MVDELMGGKAENRIVRLRLECLFSGAADWKPKLSNLRFCKLVPVEDEYGLVACSTDKYPSLGSCLSKPVSTPLIRGVNIQAGELTFVNQHHLGTFVIGICEMHTIQKTLEITRTDFESHRPAAKKNVEATAGGESVSLYPYMQSAPPALLSVGLAARQPVYISVAREAA